MTTISYDIYNRVWLCVDRFKRWCCAVVPKYRRAAAEASNPELQTGLQAQRQDPLHVQRQVHRAHGQPTGAFATRFRIRFLFRRIRTFFTGFGSYSGYVKLYLDTKMKI